MTWQRGRRPGHDLNGRAPWTKADQHRFEDKLDKRLEERDDRIDRLDDRIDGLTTKQAWVAGAVALALVIAGFAVRFASAGS